MARKKQTNNPAASSGRLGEFGSAIAQIAEEKGIAKEKVIETVEAALAAAYKKDYGKRGQHIKAMFDEVTGGARFFKLLEVVDETTREFLTEEDVAGEKEAKEKKDARDVAPKTKKEKQEGGKSETEEEKIPRFSPERDIVVEEARKIKKGVKVGDVLEIELESKSDYGRIAAQTAKQVIIQKIREAERDSMFKEYKEKEGEVINGVIQRIEGRTVFVDLGKSAGALFPSEQVETENYRIGKRLKVYLLKVESDPKGPGITLSRSHPEIIRKLFELEVPEIFSGTVEIKAIAREAGSRAKIAVASRDEGVDPIGSCVGQKGTRVQAVIDELGGEKIDIIEWNDSPEKFISAALSPANVLSIEADEENRAAKVKVPADQLSLAIGRRGQNVRLAARLTGWSIDMIGETPEGEALKEDQKDETAAEVSAESGKEKDDLDKPKEE